MNAILIATRNAHKVREIQQILGGGFHYLTLNDFPGVPPVVEDAATFRGNAAKKAEELAEWLVKNSPLVSANAPATGLLYVLADDSGLEVDALDGAPGVHSARFASFETNNPGNSPDGDNNAKLLRLLKGVPAEQRKGRFRCVLAVRQLDLRNKGVTPVNSQKETLFFEGACEGRIKSGEAGKGGFGYDPLFVPDGHSQSFAELGDDVKNTLSHRGAALRKFREFLNTLRD